MEEERWREGKEAKRAEEKYFEEFLRDGKKKYRVLLFFLYTVL